MRYSTILTSLILSLVLLGCSESGLTDWDTQSCEVWHFPGDGQFGEQCWGPPENMCKNGINERFSWYCKADGSKCCISPASNCFRCGWIRCEPDNYEDRVAPECEALNIPKKYSDCGNMKPECLGEVDTEMRFGECEFVIDRNDPQYYYCWDDHI